MRILKKIGFNDVLFNEILNSSKQNNVDKNEKELYDLRKELNDIKRICIYTDDLLKQLFANLDLSNVDIKTSNSLNEYIKGKRYDSIQK